MPRLSLATLAHLPPDVARPAYDPASVTAGIVHLGVGAFHRAHQAAMTEDILAAGGLGWGIIGASLRSTETRDALAPQDFLYTLATRGPDGETLRVIGALRSLLVAPEDPQALIAAMCRPAVKIVSLTITEKGYCLDPATGALNEDHPGIRHDVENPHAPRSAPGLLAAALSARRAAGLPPFTVLCCDNLPANGRTLRAIVSRFAGLRDPELGRFVAGDVAFPGTMVDRIVPATTAADRERIAAHLGMEDAWPVVTEPFCQWVIEDQFPSGRPDWAATFTADIGAFEQMKLRLLNGAHSAIAYLGCLAGHETVADAMSNAALSYFVSYLMNREVTPSLAVPAGFDIEAYKRDLLARFCNGELRHRTSQIAMDGSQKLPQRLLGTLRDRLRQGAPIAALALAIAAWMRYATGRDEQGRPVEVSDPLAPALRAAAAAAGPDPHRLARAFLAIPQIFGHDLPADPRAAAAIAAALDRLQRLGARQALERFRSDNP